MKLKKIAFRLILLGLIAFAGYSIFKYNTRPTKVDTLEYESRVIKKKITASGKTAAKFEAELYFLAQGNISNLIANEGDYVSKGQYLGSVNATVEFNKNKALKDQRDIALREKDIFINRYKDNDEYREEDEYPLQLRKLNEQISIAEQNYYASLNGIDNYNLYSPGDGLVIEKYKTVGEVANGPIYKIVDTSDIFFEIFIDQEDFNLISLGKEVEVLFDTYPDREYIGTIVELPKITEINGDLKIKIKLNTTEGILPGLTGDAIINTQAPKSVEYALPFDKIYEEEDGDEFLWVYDAETQQLKKEIIQTGLEGDIYVEIKTDISDLILVENEDLEEGAKIELNK